jgi:tRNA-splicing endonuclease subunit Sen34
VEYTTQLSLHQQMKNAVFADLHSKGYFITVGNKFGGDFLAYPGDPNLYHSHYVVRVVLPQQQLHPVVLRAVARGVHAARKHLVLAIVSTTGAEEQLQKQQQDKSADRFIIKYITLAKSDGFGVHRN